MDLRAFRMVSKHNHGDVILQLELLMASRCIWDELQVLCSYVAWLLLSLWLVFCHSVSSTLLHSTELLVV